VAPRFTMVQEIKLNQLLGVGKTLSSSGRTPTNTPAGASDLGQTQTPNGGNMKYSPDELEFAIVRSTEDDVTPGKCT
jgi:hypothetical protein